MNGWTYLDYHDLDRFKGLFVSVLLRFFQDKALVLVVRAVCVSVLQY